ncbi:DNA cytosine methyltransferase [Paenibacillus tepidiphilus]|uniref:DNA cytosine methyltransferase n=1 Tax=Paenibacillus tepidiphilus TaxID=2608683 RepID=UPI0012384F45|nr:DNA cytosine methyltransferase [Paenibacillus tepidiphilus]
MRIGFLTRQERRISYEKERDAIFSTPWRHAEHRWQALLKLDEKYRDVLEDVYLDEIFVDNFAGGGGASTGIEMAIGRSVDVAINHDPDAISMHCVNHPETKHYCESVWDKDPREVAAGRPVGLVWFSPDCKHFSKAKGGKPVEKNIRGLAWVAVRWAATVRPRVIILENVEEFKTWGPLIPKRDPETGRMLKRISNDNEDEDDLIVVSEPDETVPYEQRVLIPDPKRKGITFKSFVNALRRQGYEVEWRELRACDFGAPTIRKRLFLIARCDGRPIVWPETTHGDPESKEVKLGLLKPWRTAAEIIDWDIPCPSIFDSAKNIKKKYGINVKRPLSANTERRIFRSLDKYIIQVSKAGGTPFLAPYLIKVNHQGEQFRGQSVGEPLQTVTAKNGWGIAAPILAVNTTGHPGSPPEEPLRTITTENHHMIVSPTLIEIGYGEGPGQSPRAPGLQKPLGTVVSGGRKHALVTAHIARHFGESVGSAADKPIGTVTAGGGGHSTLVTSHLVKLRGTCKDGQPVTEPMPTITAGGLHVGEVRARLIKYNGSTENGQKLVGHLDTSKDLFGLITIEGVDYQIVDVGMRMLKPRELFRANGFPESYIIDVDANGNKYPEKDQVARCGNAVPPAFANALVRANLPEHCTGSGRKLSLERYKPETETQMAFSL